MVMVRGRRGMGHEAELALDGEAQLGRDISVKREVGNFAELGTPAYLVSRNAYCTVVLERLHQRAVVQIHRNVQWRVCASTVKTAATNPATAACTSTLGCFRSSRIAAQRATKGSRAR